MGSTVEVLTRHKLWLVSHCLFFGTSIGALGVSCETERNTVPQKNRWWLEWKHRPWMTASRGCTAASFSSTAYPLPHEMVVRRLYIANSSGLMLNFSLVLCMGHFQEPWRLNERKNSLLLTRKKLLQFYFRRLVSLWAHIKAYQLTQHGNKKKKSLESVPGCSFTDVADGAARPPAETQWVGVNFLALIAIQFSPLWLTPWEE